jgi:hypothetical protein
VPPVGLRGTANPSDPATVRGTFPQVMRLALELIAGVRMSHCLRYVGLLGPTLGARSIYGSLTVHPYCTRIATLLSIFTSDCKLSRRGMPRGSPAPTSPLSLRPSRLRSNAAQCSKHGTQRGRTRRKRGQVEAELATPCPSPRHHPSTPPAPSRTGPRATPRDPARPLAAGIV